MSPPGLKQRRGGRCWSSGSNAPAAPRVGVRAALFKAAGGVEAHLAAARLDGRHCATTGKPRLLCPTDGDGLARSAC